MTSNNLHTWPLSVSFVTDIVVIFYNNSLVNCENCANSVSVCTLTYIGIPTPTLHSRIVLQTKKKKKNKKAEWRNAVRKVLTLSVNCSRAIACILVVLRSVRDILFYTSCTGGSSMMMTSTFNGCRCVTYKALKIWMS